MEKHFEMNPRSSAFLLLILLSPFASAAAELFLKIEKQGYYSVSIADQTLITASNTFRFFDLAAGSHTITVTNIYGGNVLFTGTITLQNNNRKVVRLDPAWNLRGVADLKVEYSNWYTEKNGDTVVVTDTVVVLPPSPADQAMSASDFENVKDAINDQSYESGKLETAKSITKKNKLTADQIRQICLLLQYESSRLDYAKFAYDSCVDKKNYYTVKSAFGYSSSGSDLERFLEKK